MNQEPFVLNPADYGLPTRDQLKELRIWDTHYHGFWTTINPIGQHHEMMYYVDRMGVEHVVSVDIGGTLQEPLMTMPYDNDLRDLLVKHSDRVSGIVPIDPGFPEESCAKMEKWIKNGPCIGIKYVGGNKLGITCDHPNNDQIIRYASELDAAIYIHTWIKVGGTPAYPGGANLSGESTPMHVATLAKRFPDIRMICGHAGGDWELATKAIRPYENVLFEFAGADPHSGSVDLAVNELGADRIVWGGHGPSRSYSTEISKVLDASVSHDDQMKIFGRNYRGLVKDVFKKKGISIVV